MSVGELVLRIKNWRSYQHYQDRNPAWIKLHKSLLDDYEFHCLPAESRALAPMLWLLASDGEDGTIPTSIQKISFRLRTSPKSVLKALKPLIEKGFIECLQDASGVLAECKQLSILEERREETEGERDAPASETLAVRESFDYYLQRMNLIAELNSFTPEKRQKGILRYRECLKKTKGDHAKASTMLKIAIDNLAASDFHMGRDPKTNGQKYNDWIKNLMKSTEQFEKWLNVA